MQDRPEEAGELTPRVQWSGVHGLPALELEVRPEPQAAAHTLPDTYGVPRLEFLLVDPDFAYVSWELTAEQVDDARKSLGAEAFDQRVLQLRLLTEGSGDPVAGFNLYGEVGRWFIQPSLAGSVVTAVLGFAYEDVFHELLRRGPVAFPRNQPVGAEHFVELHVDYERGPQGQLLLAGRSRSRPQPWPERLPPAARAGWESTDGTSDEDVVRPGGSWDLLSSRGLYSAGRIHPGPTVPAGDRDD